MSKQEKMTTREKREHYAGGKCRCRDPQESYIRETLGDLQRGQYRPNRRRALLNNGGGGHE